jgi:hypothetical protein
MKAYGWQVRDLLPLLHPNDMLLPEVNEIEG